MFSEQTYIDRRRRLREQISSGQILLLGNQESPMNYAGNTYHFRQDSTFLYFFGLDFAGLAGVIDCDEGKDYIFGNDLTVDDIIWMGTQPTLGEKAAKAGVTNTRSLGELKGILENAQAQNRTIHILPPYRSENKITLHSLLGTHPEQLQESVSVELIRAVVNQRKIKSEEEIAEIEKAVNVTVDMHRTAMRMVKPGITEAQVAAAVQEVAVAAGGQVSFPIIATIHGETLHNHFHGNTLQSGDLFLLDAGAETALHYAGDLTRTVPVDREFTQRQKDIYSSVLAVQEKAVSMLRPGITNMDVHLAACKVVAQRMKELGLIQGDIDEAVAQGAHAIFLPHGLGHMMGLDVHDMEDLGEVHVGYDGKPKSSQFGLNALRLGRELEPGFVLTIEPGIYFIPELIDKWRVEGAFTDFLNYDKLDEYKDFGGIRIEEDFVITQDGSRLLGKPLPKNIEDVEAERRG